MVVVAQLVELQIVVLAVVGSSPIDHPPETVGLSGGFFYPPKWFKSHL